MASRREFIQSSLAVSAAALAATPAAAAGGVMPIRMALYDRRFAPGRAFGGEAERLGLQTRPIEGDVTGLWTDELALQWAGDPAPIAGLTATNSLFCLEQLARDHGMRVVFRIEHSAAGAKGVEHACFGPTVLVRQASDLGLTGSAWGADVARLLVRCPAQVGTIAAALLAARSLKGSGEPLVSWIIAPIRRG